MGGMYQGPRIFIFPFVLNHYGIKRHANNELLTCYKVFFHWKQRWRVQWL